MRWLKPRDAVRLSDFRFEVCDGGGGGDDGYQCCWFANPASVAVVREMKHYYENVPSLGNVALSRHAQDRAYAEGIPDAEVERVLLTGKLVPDTHGVSFRELNGIRLVIIHRPTPFRGAALVTSIFRIERQKRVR